MNRSGKYQLIATGLIIALLFAFASMAKSRSFVSAPGFHREGDRLLFWTESAFHYRYAKMFAEGESIPRFDLRAQMPEGLEVYRHITVAMEIAAGGLYRILHAAGAINIPFHIFLVHFICWFSSLSIIAVFLAASAVWPGRWAGLAAAAAYTLVPLSYGRVIGHYGREDFALPLLFLFFAFFLRSLTARSFRRALLEMNLAGLFAFASLGSWHLSRFFFLMFAPAILILVLTSSRRKELGTAIGTLTVWCVAASLLIPVLAEKRFLFSAPMLVLYASSLSLYFAGRFDWSRGKTVGILLGITAALFVVARVAGGYPEYSHVYALIRYKLQYLGVKPADPALLPFEARILWSPPFNTPGLPFLIVQGGIFLLWGIAALAKGAYELRHRRLTGRGAVLLYSLFAFAALFALIQRVSSFVIFFLVLMLPIVLNAPSRRRRIFIATLLVASLAWQFGQNVTGQSSPAVHLARALSPPADASEDVPNYGNNRRLIEWMRRSTDRDAVFLTWYPTGPTVLLDGERPIILHSKFESSIIREKYRRLLEGLYGEEDEMVSVCEEYGADYLLFQISFTLDQSDDSELYRIGLEALPARSTAFLMHFYPGELRRFTPVYQDSYYRVFRFHPEGEAPVLDHPLPYEEVWEGVQPARGGEWIERSAVAEARSALHRRAALADGGNRAIEGGRRAEAVSLIRTLREFSPDCEEGAMLYARLLVEGGDGDEALAVIDAALEKRPESSELWFAKGEVLRQMEKPYRAARAYTATLERNPQHPGARALLDAFGPK